MTFPERFKLGLTTWDIVLGLLMYRCGIQETQPCQPRVLACSYGPHLYNVVGRALLESGMSKGNRPCCYCFGCLKKFTHRQRVSEQDACPVCGGDVRTCKSKRTRAATVTRLKRLRGLKPPGPERERTEYEKYIVGPLWRTIRTRVLIRDNSRCRECDRMAEEVHHLSYGKEVMEGRDDSKLVSLCRACHKDKHPNKTKKRRARPVKPKATRGTKSERKVNIQNKKRRTAMERDRQFHARMCGQ